MPPNMTRLALAALLAAGVALTAVPARADVTLTFQNTSPALDLQFSAGAGFFNVMPTGAMNFLAGPGAAEQGFGPAVRTYCAEIFGQVSHGVPTPYAVVPLQNLPNLQIPPAGAGPVDPATRANFITELWGRFESLATGNVTAAAFALSIWKLMYDPLDNRTDFSDGFIRFSPGQVTNPAVTQAVDWLGQLSGDTSYFTDNPLYAGQSLVGLTSAGAQDQIGVQAPANPVPAPAGAALAALGAGVLALRSRRVRK